MMLMLMGALLKRSFKDYDNDNDYLVKEYDFGKVYIDKVMLMAEESTDSFLHLNIKNFPPVIVARIFNSDSDELDNAFNEFYNIVCFEFKEGIIFDIYSDTIFISDADIECNIELICGKDKLLNIVDNLSQLVDDYIKFLTKTAEEVLRKYKPDELEDFTCSRCNTIMKNYEKEIHLKEHEIDDARAELRIVEQIISKEYRIPDKTQYSLAFKHFVSEIEDMIKEYILPMYKSVIEEIDQRVKEMKIKHVDVTRLYTIKDVLKLLQHVPSPIRRFLVEQSSLRSYLSNKAYYVICEGNDQKLDRLMEEPNFSILVTKSKRNGWLYVTIFNNGRKIAYIKVDKMLKKTVRDVVSCYINNRNDVESITNSLYNKIVLAIEQQLNK